MPPAPAHWYRDVAAFLCPNGWPRSYVVIDIETNGIGDHALPLQIAWLSVYDGIVELEQSGCKLLNWTLGSEGHAPEELARTIENTRRTMASKGKPYHLTMERIQQDGIMPEAGLLALWEAVRHAANAAFPIVGYNHIGFDIPILDRCMTRAGSAGFYLLCGDSLDIGLVEKARLHRLSPLDDEARHEWYWRVAEHRGYGGWSLDLARSLYALPCDPTKAHDAGVDCFDTHLLLEAMRAISAGVEAA